MKWYTGLEHLVSEHVPLAPLTWYRLGGAARFLCTPTTADEVRLIVARARECGLPVRVLGAGANVLVRDEGFGGIVIRLCPRAFGAVQVAGAVLTAGGAADLPDTVRRSVRAGLAGLECLAGIPGSIGGALRMNAGGRFGQIGDHAREVLCVDAAGDLRLLQRSDLSFEYRRSNLAGCIVLQAGFDLQPAGRAELRERYHDIWEYKKSTQPFTRNNAGCMFKNPPGHAAGQLIDRAGLKGARIGGAAVCQQHANFIVASPGACASDVLRLVEHIRERVRASFNVELEQEVEVW